MNERAQDTWVHVGTLGKTFGLKGEVVVHYTGETPDRFRPGSVVHIVTAEGRVPARIASMREMPAKLVVAFEGRASVDEIRPWVGCALEVRASELPPLEAGSYYHYELLGLEVYSAGGELLGRIEEILETGGNDIFCVRKEGREILVPAIDDAIDSIDPAAGRVVLKDMKGLIAP
ncbi:MAG: 16S rRNA processing protein RimM [Candidatus Eisenbacteria bacterium]|nr:16S rRNA processing protein RimM [Candidatus Eisenbacteria bacterium]